MRHIPNILSAIRLLLVGVFIYFFVNDQVLSALITYLVAFVTDIVDGYLARRNNWITNVGKVLDPLADKLMLIAALACFYFAGWIDLWLLAIVVGKELLMIIGGAALYKHKIVVYSDWFGKLAAGFFNAGVAVTLAKKYFAWEWIGPWNIVLLCIAIVLAIIALFHYANKQIFSRIRAEQGQQESET